MHSKRALIGVAVVALIVLGLPMMASAATNTFTGTLGQDWNTAANWSDGVPDAGDDVVIPVGKIANLSAGADGVANSLDLVGTLQVTGLSLTLGAGTSSIASTLSLNNATLNLGAATTWASGNINLFNTSTVVVGAGEELQITGPGGGAGFDNGNALWHNQGTIDVQLANASALATVQAPFENDGQLNVLTGILRLGGGDGVGSSAGDYAVASGAGFVFGGAFSQNTHDLIGPDGSVTGPGAVHIGGNGLGGSGTGTVAVNGATFDVGSLQLAGGILQLDTPGTAGTLGVLGSSLTRSIGSATLTVSGTTTLDGSDNLLLSGTGATTLGGTATIATGAAGTVLTIGGTHTLNLPPQTTWTTGHIAFANTAAQLIVGPGDSLDIDGDPSSSGSGSTGGFNNQGTVNRTTSSGTVQLNIPFSSSGTINVDSGAMNFQLGLTQMAGVTVIDAGTAVSGAISLQGGTLEGEGTASGNVTNTGGTVKPGTSPGKLTIGGDYIQGPGGALEVEIAGTTQGTDHDWLAAAGDASLDGTLDIVNDPGFTPSQSDGFDVITADGTVSGTFSTINGAQTADGDYTPTYTAGPPGKVTLGLASPPTEPRCSDGIDNDGDSEIDHPDDLGCTDPTDDDETDPPDADCSAPTMFGTPGDDVLMGTEARDVIVGLGGDDEIHGLGGDDELCGGSGNDVLIGGSGKDRLAGGSGNDTLKGEAGNDALRGHRGKDKLAGGGGKDKCVGGAQTDRASGCEKTVGVP